jgi:hypothetical protein
VRVDTVSISSAITGLLKCYPNTLNDVIMINFVPEYYNSLLIAHCCSHIADS